MAKRVKVEPERMAVLERVAKRFLEIMQPLENVYTPEMLITVPTMYGTQYKQKPIKTAAQYFIQNVRVGASGQLIFEFTPVDKQDFKFIDIDESKLDDVFPTFAPEFGAAIGSSHEAIKALIAATEAEILIQDKAAAEAKVEEEAENDKAYEEHPLFGAF